MTEKLTTTTTWNKPIQDPYGTYLHEQLSKRDYSHALTIKVREFMLGREKQDEALAHLHRIVRILANRLEKRARARRRASGLPPREIDVGFPETTSKIYGVNCSPHYHGAFRLDETLTEADIAECVTFIKSHKSVNSMSLDVYIKIIYDKSGWIRYCMKNMHTANASLTFIIRPSLKKIP